VILSFYPLLPAWLIMLLVAMFGGVGYYAYRHRNPSVTRAQHMLLLALRMLSILVITLMLLCPGRIVKDRNLERSHIVFLVDNSASMATRDLPNRQSRLARSVNFLHECRLPRLSDYPRSYYRFSNRVAPGRNARSFDELTAEGGTRFRQAFDRIDKDVGLDRTAAVILVTDGIDYSGFRGSELAVPIMSIRVGTDMSEVKDLGIEPFKYPTKVTDGEEVTLDIPLLMHGYAREQDVGFSVSVDGRVIYTNNLVLTRGRVHEETVKTILGENGIHMIRLDCQSLPDEVCVLNNRRELAVEVVQAKDEVAVYFPVLNNSFRPLLREFSKDRERAFTAFYRVAKDSFRLRGPKPNKVFANGLPHKANLLKNVTCLILGSHNDDLVSPAEALVLEQYVSQGGTLICLAGTDSYGKLPPGSPLTKMLPVVPLEQSFRPGKFEVLPDENDKDAFAQQIRAILEDNRGSPDLVLSGINHVKDIKANAGVLLWAEAEARHPLLVWHQYGHGKVVALLSNSFHQWGTPDKRQDNFGKFWRQLVAFAKNQDENADLLKVALAKTELASGETVSVTAIARHPEGRDDELSVKADLFPIRDSLPIESLSLDRKADHFSCELPGLQAGRYMLRVSSQDSNELIRTRYKFLLVGDVVEENLTVRVNPERFRQYSSEKHIFDPDDMERLEEAIRSAVRKNVVRREEFVIFETPVFFLLAVALLMLEWALRRRFNLF
jgi:hypothetical protein